MLRNVMLVLGCALALAACTPSETACLIAEEVKLTFDDYAAEGAFSASEIVTANAIYNEGIKVCHAPPGTYDQATVIRTAGAMARTLRKIMSQNEVAYQAVVPKLDKLQRMLELEARP